MGLIRTIILLFIVSFSTVLLAQNYRVTNCSDTTFNGLYLVSPVEPVQYLSASKAMYALENKKEGWIITDKNTHSETMPYLFNSDTLSLKFPPISGWELVMGNSMTPQSEMKVVRINKQHFPVWVFPLLLFVAFMWITLSGKRKSSI